MNLVNVRYWDRAELFDLLVNRKSIIPKTAKTCNMLLKFSLAFLIFFPLGK